MDLLVEVITLCERDQGNPAAKDAQVENTAPETLALPLWPVPNIAVAPRRAGRRADNALIIASIRLKPSPGGQASLREDDRPRNVVYPPRFIENAALPRGRYRVL